jgi:hypothetical protein
VARRFAPLSLWQLEVLQWIGDGCPERSWPNTSYKLTANALAERQLVTVSRRGGTWQVAITNEGRFYLDRGSYRPVDPEHRTRHRVQAGTKTKRERSVSILPQTLLAELQASGGTIKLSELSPAMRGAYRSAISRAITERLVPNGYCIRHSGRDGGDLVIRLVSDQERAARLEPLPPICIPMTLRGAHPDVLELRDDASGRLEVSDELRDRALRVLQAIADECERRGYDFAVPNEASATCQVAIGADQFPLWLYEEHQARDVPDPEQLAAAKYLWQRIPAVTAELPTGRLAIRLEFESGYQTRTRSWADRQRWTLDDKLPAMFRDIAAIAADQAAARERLEAARLQRGRDWDDAVERARRAYVRHLNRDRLQKQITHLAEAEAIRAYCSRLDQLAEDCADPERATQIRAWSVWAREEAERTDPLNKPDKLAYRDPADIRSSDIEPFMPRGMSPWRRPD